MASLAVEGCVLLAIKERSQKDIRNELSKAYRIIELDGRSYFLEREKSNVVHGKNEAADVLTTCMKSICSARK